MEKLTDSKTLLSLSIIGSAALVVRLLYLYSLQDTAFFDVLQTNALRYHQWALLLLEGTQSPLPPFEQPPGYPYFLASLYRMVGTEGSIIEGVQAVLDAGTCVGIAVLARGWFGPRAGIIAGSLAAVYGPLIYFSAERLPATLFLCLVTLAMVLTQRSGRASGRAYSFVGRWGAAGVWGMALFVRSEIVLAFPLVVLDAWYRGGRRQLTRTVLVLGICLGMSAAINVAYSQKFTLLTTGAGINMWLGNNPYADGVNPFVFGPLSPVADAVRQQAGDAVEADAMFRRHVWQFWLAEPQAALQLAWKKFVWLWTDRELPNNSDIEWRTGHSWLFALRPLFPLSFGWIVPLAAVGAVLLGRRWRGWPLLCAPLAVGVLTSLLFLTNARFRLVMVPSLVVLAALAIDRLPALLRESKGQLRKMLLCGMAALLGAALAWGNFSGVRTYYIPQISVITGAFARESGQFEEAIFHLRRAVVGDPNEVVGWIHLALAHEQQGQVRAALRTFLAATAENPTALLLQERAEHFFIRHRLDPALLSSYAQAGDGAKRQRISGQLQQRLSEQYPTE